MVRVPQRPRTALSSMKQSGSIGNQTAHDPLMLSQTKQQEFVTQPAVELRGLVLC